MINCCKVEVEVEVEVELSWSSGVVVEGVCEEVATEWGWGNYIDRGGEVNATLTELPSTPT
jgi:hypothetical protein